ncbi:Na+/H+ antiporter [Sphingomonas metalli]|uniref:Na+/H+ antiporter n=1 Tax=Sphingomonas metalli TaxID=1779358 RepID=A0A916SWX8_9SPHN|nr:Na+/H+ antiporter [Sphingomonas metalli]GGB21814.1 Na+/H+ antiporter [Sphingomonas metalli]
MDVVTLCLFLLLAVVVSGIVSRLLPSALPRPLVQIALGALIGGFAHVRVELDPELFFLLLVPPLLFLDGWRIPKDELLRDARTVLGLALGLVFLTVLGVGLFVHWLIPAMPLPVAFALAAVVSPTDPIAVGAVAQKVTIPRRMMHILEGESLLNDASGLVCLRFAIAAALSGSFSPSAAATTFAYTAVGGVAVGAGLTWAVVRGKALLAQRFGDEVGSNILISLLIPFGAYLAAEHIHASGVLAAAAAGIAMTFAGSGAAVGAATRIRRRAVWDMLQFTLNGVVFVLLGEQLPDLFHGARRAIADTGHDSGWWLLAYVLAIVAVLAALRFGWVWLSLRFTLFRARLSGRSPAGSPPRRVVAAMSVAGARGAITLAGALTLPLTLNDGSPLPARDLVILLASGVILASLVIAAAGLPLLLRGLRLPSDAGLAAERDRARTIAARAAILEIERVRHAMCAEGEDPDRATEVAARLMEQYRERIESLGADEEARAEQNHDRAIERSMRLAAIRAERQAIFDLARQRELGLSVAEQLGRELDLADARWNRMAM